MEEVIVEQLSLTHTPLSHTAYPFPFSSSSPSESLRYLSSFSQIHVYMCIYI